MVYNRHNITMKKVFLILIAVIGLGISANAQVCLLVGNVEPTIISGTNSDGQFGYINIKLVNTNDYKVTVDVLAEIVLKSGTTKTIKRTVVVNPPKAGTTAANEKIIKTSIAHGSVDIDASSVNIHVQKCD